MCECLVELDVGYLCIAVSASGTNVAAAVVDRVSRIWDIGSGQAVHGAVVEWQGVSREKTEFQCGRQVLEMRMRL